MSVLAIDLGNSRWKMAIVDDGRFAEVVSGCYDDFTVLDEALQSAKRQVDRALVASVASVRKTAVITAQVADVCGVAVTPVVGSRPLCGVTPGYRKPEQLGVDRLLAMIAVRSMTERPFCVIDAGTAVTLDFVDRHGLHLGGFILPGQQLARASLLQQTAIPKDSTASVEDVLGRDTPTGVLLGSRYAAAAIAEMFLSGSRSLFPQQQAELYLGGGDADGIGDALSVPYTKLDHLVLRGIAVVALSGEV